MARAYHYRVDAVIPSLKELEFMKKNALANGWGPHTSATDKVWRFAFGPFIVVFTDGEPFTETGSLPTMSLVTEMPITEDTPDATLASFVRHVLVLLDGLYIEEFRAERIEVDE